MRRWPFVALFLGLILQVTAWILVIPPYSSYDEFDHVYRASSVWHGQVTTIRNPPPGYPGAVIADEDLVTDGVSECMRLPYTGLGRCLPGPPRRDGTVLISSGAALYNPLYYALVSPATTVGQGAATVVWMRIWSAVLTFSVIGWALALLAGQGRTRPGVLGVALAASPMLAISMAVVAPNGLEMAAGLLWWVSLISVTGQAKPRWPIWSALALSGCLLATLRSLGPVFLAVSLATLVIWRGPALRALWRSSRTALITCAASITGALGVSGIWILTQHLQAIESTPVLPDVGLVEGIVMAAGYVPAMVTLFIGAIPARNIAPPSLAVAGWLIPFTLLLVNVRWRRSRDVGGLLALVGVVLIFPVVFQGVLFGQLGFVWQSRYILPLAIGVPILAALQARSHPARNRINDVVTLLGLLLAHVSLIRFGLSWYGTYSPLVSAGRFPLVIDVVPVLLTVAGAAATGTALWLSRRADAWTDGSPESPDRTGGLQVEGLPPLVSSGRWSADRPA